MRRALVLLFLLAWAAPAAAQRDDQAVRAARLLASWQFDQARALIDELARERPRAPETRYLRGELAFLDGRYAEALAAIEGLPDRAVGGNVGALRALATSTYETTRGFAVARSRGGHFEIHYPPGKDEVIVDLAGDVLEAAYDALADDLGYRPDTPIRVEILSDPADLARVSTLTESEIATTGTIALCKYGKLMVVTPRATIFGYPWMDTLTHEYVHYVVSRASHDQVPVWLHEGLARYLQVRWRSEASTRLSAVDEHLLAAALAKRELIAFDDMHPSMAKLPSQEAAALAFAEVYTMIGYVHEKVGDAGLRRILSLHKSGVPSRKAVAQVMGQDWADVERGWKRHLRSLDLDTSAALAGRAEAPRIRFRKGDGRDENVGIDQVRSEKARKLTRLGGLLRARGLSEAAAIEYEKALAVAGKDDPFVAGKLSRTYLEIGRYEDAIDLATPLAKADDTDATPTTTIGLAQLELGDHAAAARALERSLRISPFDPAVRCGLAEAYARLSDARENRERAACAKLR